MFVVKFKCKEAMTDCGEVLTVEDQECWLMDDPEGWISATSCPVLQCFNKVLPSGIKTFKTESSATKFITSWKGHPWYYIPNGNFEVFKAKGNSRKVLTDMIVCIRS